jgi:hypothetical protein
MRETVDARTESACVVRYGERERIPVKGEATDEERWRCEVPSKETSDGSKRSRSMGSVLTTRRCRSGDTSDEV